MLNRIILIGRLVADPELKYTPSGVAVATFRIAVDRPMSSEARSQGQERQTDFIDITAWRQSAEFASQYLGKGRMIAVEGRLQIREYQTQDGQRRKAAEVVADNLRGLDRPRENQGDNGYTDNDNYEGGGGRGGFDRPARPAAPRGRMAPPSDNYDDDISDPFAE